jgi:hypothetical protein
MLWFVEHDADGALVIHGQIYSSTFSTAPAMLLRVMLVLFSNVSSEVALMTRITGYTPESPRITTMSCLARIHAYVNCTESKWLAGDI